MDVRRFITRFAYEVDAIPKRHRLPRRMALAAETEIPIVRVRGAEAEADAVVSTVFDGPYADGRAEQEVSTRRYASWGGRLWIPADDETGGTVRLRAAERAFREGHLPGLPANLVHGYETALGSAGTQSEGEFEGEVVWSGKTDAIRRLELACTRLLFIGDSLHVRSDGPMWTVPRRDAFPLHRGQVRLDHDHLVVARTADAFAADRLEDAVALCAARFGGASVHGRIAIAPGTPVPRDDLACAMAGRLVTFASRPEIAVTLEPDAMLAWRRVFIEVRAARPFPADGVAEPAATLRDIRLVAAALRAPGAPAMRRGLGDKIAEVLASIDDVEELVAFEAARGRGPGAPTAPEDEAALAALAP